jgi:hypothetical protein
MRWRETLTLTYKMRDQSMETIVKENLLNRRIRKTTRNQVHRRDYGLRRQLWQRRSDPPPDDKRRVSYARMYNGCGQNNSGQQWPSRKCPSGTPPPSPSPNTPVTALQEIVNILLYLLANKKRSAVKVVDVKPVEHKGEKRKLVLTEDGTVYN